MGFTHRDAEKFAGEWFHLSKDTVRDSYRRVLRAKNTTYFLSRSCEASLDRRATERRRRERPERWAALMKKYEARRPAPDFLDDTRGRL